MKIPLTCLTFIMSLLVTAIALAQPDQQIVSIGDFTTTEGAVIKDCKVGYRTVGKLNSDKSNVIPWPTWFTGTSGQIVNFGTLQNAMDTTGYYFIVVDALTNGVSSSPSNTPDFPLVSIRDMVESQYLLLTEHLGIDHVFAVMGISMGGMQAFDWMVAYPNFMDKVVPIIGTPKQSFYDKLVWQTQADLITAADDSNREWSYQRAQNITQMNLFTPTFMASEYSPDSLQSHLERQYANQAMKPEDYLGGLNAMIPLDIYENSGRTLDNLGELVKADVLIIVATEDHLVNPISSMDLAEKLGYPLATLTGPCGHMAPGCEADKVQEVINEFFK